MNESINNIIKTYNPRNIEESKLALREIIQNVVLIGLSKTDFFKHASFYGGTALRIFYGLNRFSEDLDFTLLESEDNFTFEPYFKEIETVANSYGIDVQLVRKDKNIETPVESAFAKVNTFNTFIQFKLNNSTIHRDEVIKVKLEVDKQPALGYITTSKWITSPELAQVSVLDEGSLFSGKIHALLCRKYKNTVKGRDYYDYIFYLKNNVSPNLIYLRNKLIDSKKIETNDNFDIDVLKTMLNKQFETVDFNEIRKDIERFTINSEDLSNYNEDLFKSLTNNL